MALDLEAVKARYAFLGDQPWRVGRKVGRTLYRQVRMSGPSDTDLLIGVMDNEDDATFVAAARTDVPALVAEVEQLRADLGIANEATLVLVARAADAEATFQRLIAQQDGAARRVAELEVRSLADEVRAAQEATRAARGAWADQ